MKKVSNASFVIGIVFIVLGIVLNVLGFLDINGVRYVQYYGNRFYSMTYTTSTSQQMFCMALIIAGGFLFLGGIMLFILSAVTCPCRCKGHHEKDSCKEQPKSEEAHKVTCQCQAKADTTEPVKQEEPETEAPEESAEQEQTTEQV